MKRLLCMMLIAALLIYTLPAAPPVLATALSSPALPGSEKEEIVYARLAADGSTESVYVVNHFERELPGAMRDYGDYAAVASLSAGIDFASENGVISAELPAGESFYQGELRQTALPWQITVGYILDGRELAAADLAGQSGKLEIKLNISRDERVDALFFDNYALQIAITLDSGKCRNIQAEGATIASVGKTKTVSFIVFARQEKEISVTARVSDFAMDGIQLVGIPLNLSLDDVDSGRFAADIDELVDGARQLDDGAEELQDGVGEISDAVAEFSDGLLELDDGVRELAEGAEELAEGGAELYDGADSLADGVGEYVDGVGELRDGARDFDDGIGEFAQGLDEYRDYIKSYAEGFDAALGGYEQVFSGAAALESGSAAFIAGLRQYDLEALQAAAYAASLAVFSAIANGDQEEITTSLAALSAAVGNLAAAQALSATADQYETNLHSGISGINIGLNSTNAAQPGLSLTLDQLADGANSLYQGARELAEGGEELSDGMGELYDGIRELHKEGGKLADGASELADGVYEFYRDGILEFRDGIIELKQGTAELAENSVKLKDGMVELNDGVAELKDGTGEFRRESGSMEGRMEEQIRELLDEYGGRDFVPQSFVDQRNQVSAVQFVLRTADIAVAETPQQQSAAPEKTGVWQRIKALGSYWTRFTEALRGLFA